MCFVNYALRLGLISILPNPWWAIAVELFLQGPTYAMSYTTIVAYASAVSPPGTSATMQGIVAGIDDGLGTFLIHFENIEKVSYENTFPLNQCGKAERLLCSLTRLRRICLPHTCFFFQTHIDRNNKC